MKIYDLMLQNNLVEPAGVTHEETEEYQRKLYNAGIAVMPMAYTGFLNFTNGVQTPTLSLFGIAKENNFVRDIYEVNSVAGTANADEIFLGDNFTEYLFYNWPSKSFVIINKAGRDQVKTFPFWEPALEYFLREYVGGTNAATLEKVKQKLHP
jgi:hypothetical protein